MSDATAALRKEAKRLYRAKDYAGAIAAYERIFAEPDAAEPAEASVSDHYGLAVSLLAMDRLSEAVGHLEQASNALPDDGRMHYKLGEVLSRLGRHSEAVTQFQAAIRCEPTLADNHWRLALELRRVGDEEVAQRHLKRCLELDPDHVDARIMEMDQVALSTPERDGGSGEDERVHERAEPRDGTPRMIDADDDAAFDFLVRNRLKNDVPDRKFTRTWVLLLEAAALAALGLWIRTLFA